MSALILYALFIVTVQITVLVVVRGPVHAAHAPATRVVVSHPVLLTIAGLCAVGAYGLAWRAIGIALAAGTSAYGALLVPGLVPLGTVYQMLHQSGLTFALLGATIYLCGDRGRYIVGRRGLNALGYLVVLGALGTLSVVMGNRSMLVFAASGAALFYLANAERPSRALIGGVVAAGIVSMSLLGIFRGAGGFRDLGGQSLVGKVRYVIADAMTQDVEPFSAHASMYGTLQKHVPLTYGVSFLWLVTSPIPAVIRPALVPVSYQHYAEHVGAFADQGFTLHHATGWYINFGVPGLIVGAVVLGWIWAALFNRFCAVAHSRSHLGRVFSTVAFWSLTAFLPNLNPWWTRGLQGRRRRGDAGADADDVRIQRHVGPARQRHRTDAAGRDCAGGRRGRPSRPSAARARPVMTRIVAATVLAGLVAASPAPLARQTAAARDWHVAPDGRPGNDGTPSRPVDLATALDGRRVGAGSTVWLGEGRYQGVFQSTLTGTEAAPITVRSRPGVRAVVADDRERASGATINVFGAWTIYRDFEVTNLNANRSTGLGFRPMGFEVKAPHTKFVNLTIHDTGMGFGFWKEAVDSELYGNVIFNCGTENAALESRHGHGIYTQNDGGTKLIRDNVLVNNFGLGIHAYPNPGGLTGLRLEGNVIADSGAANSSGAARFNNLLVSAYRPYRADRVELVENFTYLSPRDDLRDVYRNANVCLGCADSQTNGQLVVRGNYFAGGAPVAIVQGWQRVTMRSNTLVGTDAMVAVTPASAAALRDWDWDDNDYIGTGPSARRDVLFVLDNELLGRADWLRATGFDATSRFTGERPSGTKLFLRPNRYEPGRANLVIYNWDRQPAVQVDLNGLLARGAKFEIRSAMDYLGDPVASGTFDGELVSLPLNALRVAEPNGGKGTRSRTLGEFAVFVVRTVSAEPVKPRADRRPAPSVAAPPATPPRAPPLTRLVGRFVSRSPAADVQIAFKGSRLTAQIHNEPGDPVFPLTAVTATRFAVEGAAGFFVDFQVDARGLRSLTIERPGAPSVTLFPQP